MATSEFDKESTSSQEQRTSKNLINVLGTVAVADEVLGVTAVILGNEYAGAAFLLGGVAFALAAYTQRPNSPSEHN